MSTKDTESAFRCPWAESDALYRRYHDEEWGVPMYDPARLFDLLVLEGMQAGLSWRTVLGKREAIRRALGGLDPEALARFTDDQLETLRNGSGDIIRNRAKLFSARNNAVRYLALREKSEFENVLWNIVDGRPKINHFETMEQVPASTPKSMEMSKLLKGYGFNFVGPVICYAFMQSAGMVNDHLVSCFRHQACADMAPGLE